jgi:2-oxo-4-hydroxy-4-carboxy-5-ureidoimidazoline decarboxylase
MGLTQINALDGNDAEDAFLRCCGAAYWAKAMATERPFKDATALFLAGERLWAQRNLADTLEAFAHHPKIGDAQALKAKFASTREWASNEQGGTAEAAEQTLRALAEGNRHYEEKFGFIFIVCATGKSAFEMLELLNARLPNDRETELAIAAAEQAKITHLRLEKLISS